MIRTRTREKSRSQYWWTKVVVPSDDLAVQGPKFFTACLTSAASTARQTELSANCIRSLTQHSATVHYTGLCHGYGKPGTPGAVSYFYFYEHYWTLSSFFFFLLLLLPQPGRLFHADLKRTKKPVVNIARLTLSWHHEIDTSSFAVRKEKREWWGVATTTKARALAHARCDCDATSVVLVRVLNLGEVRCRCRWWWWFSRPNVLESKAAAEGRPSVPNGTSAAWFSFRQRFSARKPRKRSYWETFFCAFPVS